MPCRITSRSSNSALFAAALVCAVVACTRAERKPAEKGKVALIPAGAGGSPAAPRQVRVHRVASAGAAGTLNAALSSKYAAALNDVSGFTAAPNQFIKVPYVNVAYDEKKQIDKAGGRFKAAVAGYYQVCASLAAPTDSNFEIDLYLNGTREHGLATSRRGTAQGCRTIRLKARDYLEVWAEQKTDKAIEFAANATSAWMTVHPVPASVALGNTQTFSAPNATFTKVLYSEELYDVGGQFDPKTSRFTAALPGEYRICTGLSSDVKVFELDLYIDGQRENALLHTSSGSGSGCRTVRLSQGQYVEVFVYQVLANPARFAPNQFWNWLTIDDLTAGDATLETSIDDVTAFAVPPKSVNRVPYAAKTWDPDNQFNATTNRFTTTAPADYLVCASLVDSQEFELFLFVNGNRDKTMAVSTRGIAQGCRATRLSKAGDFLEVWTQQNGTTVMNVAPNTWWNWMTVEKFYPDAPSSPAAASPAEKPGAATAPAKPEKPGAAAAAAKPAKPAAAAKAAAPPAAAPVPPKE
jgi:hypothetical protein